MKEISQIKLARFIYDKRLKKTISFKRVYTAVKIIKEELIKSMLDDVPVSIKHFGTLSPYWFHEHKASPLRTQSSDVGQYITECGKILQKIEKFRSIKLHAHESFRWLIEQRRDKLKKSAVHS